MEVYVLSNNDLSILTVSKLIDYDICLDEETNSKSTFFIKNANGLKKNNFLVVNGLFEQFLFVIDDVAIEKNSNKATVIALDISNIFDRKIIEKDTNIMTVNSLEEFIANTISENFVNSDDDYINKPYIDIFWHTNTMAKVATNSENGLYNFHTFLTNCRQYKNICTKFRFEDKRLRIDIENIEESPIKIDTTVAEVTEYTKIYEADITAKVTVLIREDNSEYNLYLKTDRTTTENKNDPNRASGKIEVVSVDTADLANEAALNIYRGNRYQHLVELKLTKKSKLVDVSKLKIGTPIIIKTEDDVYESYISAIEIKDENYIYYKSGNIRTTLLDKLKKDEKTTGNKLDVSGGTITGSLAIEKQLTIANYKVPGYKVNEDDTIQFVDENGNDLILSSGELVIYENSSGLSLPTQGNSISLTSMPKLSESGYKFVIIKIKYGAQDKAQEFKFLTESSNHRIWINLFRNFNGTDLWFKLIQFMYTESDTWSLVCEASRLINSNNTITNETSNTHYKLHEIRLSNS